MVEIKETQNVVIAKPVAIRPSLSNLKSLSELISGSASPFPLPAAAAASTIIRPRTVRFKPVSNIHLVGDEVHQSSPENAPETDFAPSVVYKPVARLVSKRTVSLMANLGGSYGIMSTQQIADFGAPIQPSDEDNRQTDLPLDLHQNFSLQPEKKAHNMQKNSAEDNKMFVLSQNRHRASYDGHSWRKYGQKQVKGSEYPRSYYKCTHPSCPVKKKVEKTLDNRIAEIVYSGEHNHPKRQPFSRTLLDGNVQKPTMQGEARNDARAIQQDEGTEGHEGGSENPGTIGLCEHLPIMGATLLVNDSRASAGNASVSTSNDSLAQSGECEEVSESLEVEGNEFRQKRAKRENWMLEATADCDVVGDGFRWRKYGQKVVKGNPYPRSYYRCTSPKCEARKYVERTSEDPGSFITTYEGRHNHDIPIKSTDSEVSKKSSKNRS